MEKNKYSFSTPGTKVPNIKWSFGDPDIQLELIRDHTPAFSFEFIMDNNENPLSFFSPDLDKDDFNGLIETLQTFSQTKIGELLSNSDIYRFHEVPITAERDYLYTFLIDQLRQDGISKDQLPEIYQFVVLSAKRDVNPRIMGFFSSSSVFHLLWFDMSHLIYYDSNIQKKYSDDWFLTFIAK